MQTHQNYRSLIRDILIEKQKKNSKFSLRSFAKQLGVQSSFLSMVLNGKRDLSEEKANLFCEKLNLSTIETKKLTLLLRLEKATTPKQKMQIIEDLELVDPTQKGKRDLAIDQFKVIADWYHLPLQILVDLDGFEWSEEAAAKAIGITVLEVREALERLAALELIDYLPGKRPTKADGRLIVSSPFKNDALRKYHTQMLEKTVLALSEQEPTERFTGTQNIALAHSDIAAAHQILKDAMEKLFKLAEKRSKEKNIYHANLNLFRLTKLKGSKS